MDREGYLLIILNMFVKAFELADLEGEDAYERDDHQQERVDPPLHQDLHLRGHA